MYEGGPRNVWNCYKIFIENILKKAKQSCLQAWSGPEGSRKLRFRDFMTTAQDGIKVVLKHRPPLPPENAPGTHFCLRLSRPQGRSAIGTILCHWKIPMTPARIEPLTYRFVAQHLNHCATAVPLKYSYKFENLVSLKVLCLWLAAVIPALPSLLETLSKIRNGNVVKGFHWFLLNLCNISKVPPFQIVLLPWVLTHCRQARLLIKYPLVTGHFKRF